VSIFFLWAAYYYLGFCSKYFYTYWSINAIGMLLGFGVLYEVFVNALKPYAAVIDLGKMLFWWAALFLLLAGAMTALGVGGNQTSKIGAAMNLMDRSIGLMQCGLLLLLLVFEKRLGLSWRNYGFSIALGLGTFAAADLIVSLVSTRLPGHDYATISSVLSSAVLLFWTFNLMRSEPQRKNILDSPSRLIFQRWNEALAATPLGNGDVALPVDSFIPGVEQAVDRVLARRLTQ
jgi:hypothetical protein